MMWLLTLLWTPSAVAQDEPAEDDDVEAADDDDTSDDDASEDDEDEDDDDDASEEEDDDDEDEDEDDDDDDEVDDTPPAPQVSVRVWTRTGPASQSVSKVRATFEEEIEALAACWTSPTPAPVELKFTLKKDGQIHKPKVTATSLDPAVDSCVAEILDPLEAKVSLDFPEKLAARITGPARER